MNGQVGRALDRVQVLAGDDLGIEIADAAIELLYGLDELVALLDVVDLPFFQGDQALQEVAARLTSPEKLLILQGLNTTSNEDLIRQFALAYGTHNLFNEEGIVAYDEEVLTSLDTGSGLKAFNPFTETPVECPQGASSTECAAMGANFQKGPNFGLPNSEGDYQTPRTFRFSVGIRF